MHELIPCLSALRRRGWWYLHFTAATSEEQGGHTSPHTSSYQLLWSEPGHHSLRGWRQVAPNAWELRGKVLGRGSGPEPQSSTASVQSMQALASATLLRQTRPPLEITADAAELFSHKPTLCIWKKQKTTVCGQTEDREEGPAGGKVNDGQLGEKSGNRQETGEELGKGAEEQKKSLLRRGSAGRKEANEKTHV